MVLNRDIEYVRSIGPKRGAILREEAGISTIEDLVYHAPRRYLDRSKMVKIIDCMSSQEVTVAGKVSDISYGGYGRKFLSVTITDDTDELSGVFFGGTRYYANLFEIGENVLFSGKIDFFKGRKQIVHPDYDFFDEDPSTSVHTGRIIPLYHSTEKLKKAGFTSRVMRNIIHFALEDFAGEVADPLPQKILGKYGYPALSDSLRAIHFPASMDELSLARTRLAFNELFFLQYYLALSKKYQRAHNTKPARQLDRTLFDFCVRSLPFSLTDDQKKCIEEIAFDISQPYAMNRLLQGDVGSGKTIVALLASLLSIAGGSQCVIMAPTEVLARQHYATLVRFAPPETRIALLTGSVRAKGKKEFYQKISDGEIDLAVGTHALIEDNVAFKKLGLVIIDEQHRFGVAQRAALHQKGESPDLLVMTATPIPRSLTLTLYGDLDLSLIKQKPANRLPIKTLVLPESRVDGLYKSMEKYVSEGRQCFYILPLIHESEKIDLESAVAVYERFIMEIFPHRRVALLHGKLSPDEKESVMKSFAEGNTDILVSTTVVEVGIDVPNASVMVIHHPERFGLSQLHQLRGRVGRGAHQSFCVLFHPDDISDEAKKRLRIIEQNPDGFTIAEEDLKIRGAGDFLGTRQHGEFAEFEFADLASDYNLVLAAREDAVAAAESIADIDAEMISIQENYGSAKYMTGTRLARVLSLIS